MNFAVIIVVYVSLFTVVQSNPAGKLIKYLNEATQKGYVLTYQTDDGVTRHEIGSIFTTHNGEDVHSVTGDHYFKSPDGTMFTLSFIADETGYLPSFKIKRKGETLTKFYPPQEEPIPTAAIASAAGGGLGR